MGEAPAVRHVRLRTARLLPRARLRDREAARRLGHKARLDDAGELPDTQPADITHLHTQRGLQERAHAEAHHVERVIVLLEVLPRGDDIVREEVVESFGRAEQELSIRVLLLGDVRGHGRWRWWMPAKDRDKNSPATTMRHGPAAYYCAEHYEFCTSTAQQPSCG